MAQTIALTKAITNLQEAHERLDVSPASDVNFFTEWLEALPELSTSEKRVLDRLRDRYRYYQSDGSITEGTVNLILLAPLLELLGLCDPPYNWSFDKK
jgi:hypothetical protein